MRTGKREGNLQETPLYRKNLRLQVHRNRDFQVEGHGRERSLYQQKGYGLSSLKSSP